MIEQDLHLSFFSYCTNKQTKLEMLDLISQAETYELREDDDLIHETDWQYDDWKTPEYSARAMQLVKPAVDDFAAVIGCSELSINKHWFQRYRTMGNHGWHVHNHCQYSAVYYLELPDGTPPTQFRYRGKVFSPSIREGDIVFFPSCVYHRSPPNMSQKTKTVFAFNVNFT